MPIRTSEPPTPVTDGPVRYPSIKVKLTGGDGNAFTILGKVVRAIRNAGVPQAERDAFQEQATSGDYDHLLGVAQQWVDCR